MTESIYKEFENKYYNPNDNDKKPGDNDNWKSIQEGFHRIGSTQLETSAGLTLGKGTEDEVSLTPAELEAMKAGGIGEEQLIAGGSLPTMTIAAGGYTFVDITSLINSAYYNKFLAEMGNDRSGLLKLYLTGMVPALVSCIFDVSTANNTLSQNFYSNGFTGLYIRVINPSSDPITVSGSPGGFAVTATYRKG